MKSRIEEPSDLLNLARRGPLTREESRDLAAWVDEAPEARLLSDAAEVFDRDSSAQAGDDALLARIASRAAQVRQPSRSRFRRRAPMFLLAASLVLVAAAAAGGLARVRRGALSVLDYFRGTHVSATTEVVAPTGQAAALPPSASAVTISQPIAEALEPTPAVDDPSATPKADGARSRSAASRDPSVASSRDPSETADKASSLFGRANAKRLGGDDASAISLYRELAEHYAGTPQALMAEMALGKLLLAKGDATGALTHFRRYATAGGPLGVEALWGEADALRGLGRASEERHVLERLLERYPDSAYATAARKRLGTDAP